jgi:hypothetical protein
VNSKPQFEYHLQSLESLKTLLKTQSISVTTEKAINGQLGGQINNDDLEDYGNSLNQQNIRGHRLAWSRLVDLGSIDSGSNPGGPTKYSLFLIKLKLFWVKPVEYLVIKCFKWFSNVLRKLSLIP